MEDRVGGLMDKMLCVCVWVCVRGSYKIRAFITGQMKSVGGKE